MAEKILGLDIGSFSIKAALFEATFRAYRLTDLFESAPLKMDDLGPAEQQTVVAEAILRILQENGIHPATTVVGMPGTEVSTKEITLPLSGAQVEKVLPFELEGFLPFELGDLVIDHHAIRATKNETALLAAAAQKTAVADRLKTVQAAGIDPAFVSLESAALFNLALINHLPADKTIAIIDIGHVKTSVCIVENGHIAQVRSLFKGGLDLTAAIQAKLDLTVDQAVQVKHQHAILELPGEPLRSDDLKRLSAAIRGPVDDVIQEVSQTLNAYLVELHAREGREESGIDHLYLCGGTAMVKNLASYFAQAVSIPCSPYAVAGHDVERIPVFAQAISLGLRASIRGADAKRAMAINFRKGDFALARDMSGLKATATFFAKWILAIFCAGMLFQTLRLVDLARERGKIEAQVLREFKRIMPEGKSAPKTSTAAVNQMKSRIGELRRKQEVLTSGLGSMTALGVLREISAQVPAEIPMDTQEMSIDRNKVTVRATTNSFESVDRVIAALGKVEAFGKIEKGDIRETPDGKKLFTLNIVIGDAEEEKPRKGK